MSVVYPDPNTNEGPQPGVPQAARPNIIEEHPFLAIVIGLVIVVVVLMLLGKRNEKTTTSQPQSSVNGIPASGDTSGLQTDANGNPIEFVPTQNEFLNYNQTTDSNNVSNSNNQTSTNTTNTTTTNNPPVVLPHPIMCGVGLHWDAVQGKCVPNTLPGPGPVPGPPPPPTPAPPTPAPPPTAHRTYTVTSWPLPGSSLWSIATIEYGNPMKWPDIYNANRATIGNNPNLIRKGMVLNIP